MRSLRLFLALLLGGAALVLAPASASHACSCAMSPVREHAARADLIVLGTITARGGAAAAAGGPRPVGGPQPVVTATTPSGTSTPVVQDEYGPVQLAVGGGVLVLFLGALLAVIAWRRKGT